MSEESRVRAIAQFLHQLRAEPTDDLDSLRFGGTEEEIIARGSDWCTDVARAACALFQVSGFPSRVVQLADTRKAYSGHAIVEAYRAERWGALDALAGVVYLAEDGRPASAWELMIRPGSVERHYRGRYVQAMRRGQFRTAAISEYRLGARGDHDYGVSKVSAYYRSILAMSGKGWPGGLRWLHREAG